jgi:drug/metabolite transporter (DMT)-like permease
VVVVFDGLMDAENASAAQIHRTEGGPTMSFAIYIIGYIVLIVGLAIGASMLHVPQKWIAVGVVCLIGIAIIHGVTATRQKDPPS